MLVSPLTVRKAAGKAWVIRGLIREFLTGERRGGDRLTELEISERFGVSRTPVREALLEMAGLGLVELKRNCGAVVQDFGPDQIRDLYAVRSLLETEATRLASTRMDVDEIDRFVEAFRELERTGQPDSEWELDRRLHTAIAEACGNPRLANEIARQGHLIQTVRETVEDALRDIHSTTLQDHLAILGCLRDHDPDGAAVAMRRHLAQASESAVTAVEQLRSSEP
jgi:DNA-binding GntR family transcriptional regulator